MKQIILIFLMAFSQCLAERPGYNFDIEAPATLSVREKESFWISFRKFSQLRSDCKYAEALVYLDEALALSPHDYKLWYLRAGLSMMIPNNRNGGITDCNRGLDLNPPQRDIGKFYLYDQKTPGLYKPGDEWSSFE